METGIELIAAERERQVSKECWTPDHDDTHDCFELSYSAVAYVVATFDDSGAYESFWPFGSCEIKLSDPIRNLVKAGALIAAEIDRLQRASMKAEARP
jgi:hypothetical protein